MRVKIDATPAELNEKGDALIKALMRSISPVCPELAESLEKALPEKVPTLRHRALRDIHEITQKEYRKTLEAMHLDIARVLDEAANVTSAGLEFQKAMAGPFIGPRGGKWADAEHTIHWEESVPHEQIAEQAHAAVKDHVVAGAMRAAAVGADAATLKYVGAGGEGMIFEDGQGRAYKVSRGHSKSRPDKLRNEAEAMMALADSPVAHLVPKVHGYDEKHDVISRDMIQGASAGWGQSSKMHEAYTKIAAELSKRGWYAPEFKEDSFIVPQGGGEPVMVDMGFVHPKGAVLGAHLKRRVEHLNPDDDWFDFQLDVSHAYQDGAIDVATAKDYLERGSAGIKSATPDMVKQAQEGLGFTARNKGDLKAGQGWDDIAGRAVAEPKSMKSRKSARGKDDAQRVIIQQDGYTGPVAANAPLAEAEIAIRSEKYEHVAVYDADGKMLFRATSGEPSACNLTPGQLKQMRANGQTIFTHNHPLSGFFSTHDIGLAVGSNVREFRAVGSQGFTYVLTRPESGWETGLETRSAVLPHPTEPGVLVDAPGWMHTYLAVQKAATNFAKHRMDLRIQAAGGTPGDESHPAFSEEVFNAFVAEEHHNALSQLFQKWGWGYQRQETPKGDRPDLGGDVPKRDRTGQGQPSEILGKVKEGTFSVPAEPQVGDKMPVTVHSAITGRDAETHPYRVVSAEGDTAKLSRHEGSDYGPTMPKASLKHFQNDLAGKVDLPPSGNPDIDAVTSGKAKFLGKGDDGLAFKVGDKVVKVSTTVPAVPENPGHRTPEAASAMLKKQVDTANTLADAGVPGIQRSEFVQHGDKGFQIKPWVEIPEKFTREQLDAVQDSIIAMHKQGYALNDEPQAGLDAEGKPVMFDVGKAEKNAGDPMDWQSNAAQDFSRLKFLYEKHGQEMVRRDHSWGQSLWEHYKKGVDRLTTGPKANKGFARYELGNAVKQLEKEARATLKGPELEKRLAKLKEDAEFEAEAIGPDEPTKAPEAPKAPPLELTPEPAPKAKPKRTPVLEKPTEDEAGKPLPGQLSLLGGPPVAGKRKVRKPVQHVLFAEPEKQKPEDKPLAGQLPLIPRR